MSRRAFAIALLLSAGCAPPPALDAPNLGGLRAMAAEVDPARMMATVGQLAADHEEDTPLPCVPDFSERLCHLTRDVARARMRSALEALGYTVSEQSAGDGADGTRNLVAEKRGTTRPDEVVLVGAHFDAFWSGADDNSSGVAAVLEIARAASTRSFDRTIRFLGFDLEEPGLVGSTRYVATLSQGPVASLAFDCIGFSSSAPGFRGASPGSPRRRPATSSR